MRPTSPQAQSLLLQLQALAPFCHCLLHPLSCNAYHCYNLRARQWLLKCVLCCLIDLPPDDEASTIADTSSKALIVAATLLDKAPNLAGLARTAEAFGAHSMTVADLKLTRTPLFESVSVTAQHWVDIQEVKGHGHTCLHTPLAAFRPVLPVSVSASMNDWMHGCLIPMSGP